MKKQIVSLSGGIGSWCCLDRVIRECGKENVEAVFCNTLMEDGDLYRFLDDIERFYGIRIHTITRGETPKTLAWKTRFLFNTRVARCSMELKSKPFSEWLKSAYSPDEAVVCMGIDWTESHRKEKIEKNYAPYEVRFPMCEKPYLTKADMIEELEKRTYGKIKPPRLYKLGFAHNNCVGCCFKAGIGHYLNLLEVDPVKFREMANFEEEMQRYLGKNVTILRRNGKPYSLKELMEGRKQLTLEESLEIGGCACFGGDDEEEKKEEEKEKNE